MLTFRNIMIVTFLKGTVNEAPFCMGTAVNNNYSSTLFATEASRIVKAHSPTTPLFMYLAFQSVHNPYNDPIDSGIPGTDVNKTFPEIVDPTRRIYAGMVTVRHSSSMTSFEIVHVSVSTNCRK